MVGLDSFILIGHQKLIGIIITRKSLRCLLLCSFFVLYSLQLEKVMVFKYAKPKKYHLFLV